MDLWTTQSGICLEVWHSPLKLWAGTQLAYALILICVLPSALFSVLVRSGIVACLIKADPD